MGRAVAHVMSKVLIAFDFSAGSRAALEAVRRLFRGAEVRLAYAAPGVTGEHNPEAEPLPPPTADLVAAHERALLHELGGAGDFKAVSAQVVFGNPADALLSAAADFQPDVLAVGTHPRPALARLVLGSVAEQIVRRAACPVMVVRSREPK